MPIFSTDLRNINESLTKISEKISRDYFELETLQSSFNGTTKFTDVLLNTLKGKFKDFFEQTDYEVFYEDEKIKDGNNGKIIIRIDGKINLMHSIPYFCVSVALQKNERITCGIVINPITQDVFTVEDRNGFYLKDRKIRVSNRENPKESIIALTKFNQKYQDAIITKCSLLNICYLSAGKYDMVIVDNNKINELGILMVREAGGLSINIKDEIIFTNGKIKY